MAADTLDGRLINTSERNYQRWVISRRFMFNSLLPKSHQMARRNAAFWPLLRYVTVGLTSSIISRAQQICRQRALTSRRIAPISAHRNRK